MKVLVVLLLAVLLVAPAHGQAAFDRAKAENEVMAAFREAGWDYSAWTRRRIVHLSESKAHVDTEFTRYREDGSNIGSFESLYIVTRENGRWGIKLRSSFAQ